MSLLDDSRMMVKVSKLYYQEELSQNEIAKKLNLSRPTVSRYLNNAKKKGIVEIQINENNLSEIEKLVEEKYNIQEAICIRNKYNLKSALGKEASDYLLHNIKNGNTIALSAGTTVDQVVKNFPIKKSYPDTVLVPLVGGMGNVSIDIHANHIVDTFRNKLGSKSMFLHVPVVVDDSYSKEFIMNQKFVKKITDLYKSTDIAIVGIGSSPMDSTMVAAYNDELGINDLSNDEAIGDIFYNFIDKDGKKINCEWNDRTMSISFNEYKQIPLKIAVAGGIEKVDAIHAALKNKLLDVLIIDEDTAVNMLHNK